MTTCAVGTFPIIVELCNGNILGLNFQIQAYTNIGIPIGNPQSISSSGSTIVCIPGSAYSDRVFVGIQSLVPGVSNVLQTSNLVLVTSGQTVSLSVTSKGLKLVNTSCQIQIQTDCSCEQCKPISCCKKKVDKVVVDDKCPCACSPCKCPKPCLCPKPKPKCELKCKCVKKKQHKPYTTKKFFVELANLKKEKPKKNNPFENFDKRFITGKSCKTPCKTPCKLF